MKIMKVDTSQMTSHGNIMNNDEKKGKTLETMANIDSGLIFII